MNNLFIYTLVAYSVVLPTLFVGLLIDDAWHKEIVRAFWRIYFKVSGRKPRPLTTFYAIPVEKSLFEAPKAVEEVFTFEFTGQKACKRTVSKQDYEEKLLLAAKWAVSSHNTFIVHDWEGHQVEYTWQAAKAMTAPRDMRSFEEIVADKFKVSGVRPHKYVLSHDLCRSCMTAMSADFGYQTPMSYVLDAWVHLDSDECPANLVKCRSWLRNHVAWKPIGSIRLSNGGHFTRRHAHAL